MVAQLCTMEEPARGALELACKHFPGMEYKWWDKDLDEIVQGKSILCVLYILQTLR